MTSMSKDTPINSEDSIRIVSSDYQGSATIRVKQKNANDSDTNCSNNISLKSTDSNQSISSDAIDFHNNEDIVMKVSLVIYFKMKGNF